MPAVRETLEEEKFRDTTSKGVPLPIFYIKRKKGYYHGEWKDKKPEGFGRFYFDNGMYYEGDISNG